MADKGVDTYSQKKRDKKKCANYRDISLLSLAEKVYAKCLEKRCCEIVEPQLQDAQYGFRSCRSTMDQIFALQQVFKKSWEYAKEVYTFFVDLEKAYDCAPRDKLWAVMLEYDVRGQPLAAIKSLYKQAEVCVYVNRMKIKPLVSMLGNNRAFLLFCSLYIWTRYSRQRQFFQ